MTTSRNAKFQQPVDAIEIVSRAPKQEPSPLTPDELNEGQRRIAAGEDPTAVAADILMRRERA